MPAEPFRGIEPFRFMDRSIFFERKAETRTLTRLAIVYRGILLYGGQGCGKSSVVNAGLIPAALAENFQPERLRVQPVPGRELVVERIESGEEDSGEFLPSWLASESARDVRITLPADSLHSLIQSRPEDDFTPLIIFDQFEELITLFEEQPATKEAFDEAAIAQSAILEAIHQLLIDEELPVKLLFVFREDYLGKLSKLLNRHPRLRDQSLRLLPPEASALVPIIAGPFGKHPFPRPFSDKIITELCDAFAARSESGRVRLTEIQIACQTLWRNPEGPAEFSAASAIDPAAAIASLLERYTQEAIASLPEAVRSTGIVLLSRLLTTSGTRNIVEENGLIHDLVNQDEIQPGHARDALKELIEHVKLIRREIRNDTAFVEIASEFLVPWIKSQRAELEANRQAEQREKAARANAKRKQAEQREHYEKKQQELKQRRLKGMLIVGGIALILTTTATIYALNQAKQADLAKTATEDANKRLELEKQATDSLNEQLAAEKEKLSIEKAAVERQAAAAQLGLQESQQRRQNAEKTITAFGNKIDELETFVQSLSGTSYTPFEYAVKLDAILDGFRNVKTEVERSEMASQKVERVAQAILQTQAIDLPPQPGPPPPPQATQEIIVEEAMPSVVITAHQGAITSAAFGNRRPLLATCGMDNRAAIWSLTGQELEESKAMTSFLASSRDGASCVNFSPDDSRLVAGSRGRTVTVFNINDPKVPSVIFSPETQGQDAHRDIITSAAFNQPDGAFVLSTSGDGSISLWNSTDGKMAWKEDFQGIINGAVLAPERALYAAVAEASPSSSDHRLILGSGEDGSAREPVSLDGFGRRPDIDSTGQWATCASGDKRGIPLVDTHSLEVRFLPHPVPVEEALFSPNGQWLATVDRKRTLRIWHAGQWDAPVRTLEASASSDPKPKTSFWEFIDHLLAWSPDSTRLLVSAQQTQATVWEVGSGTLLQCLTDHSGLITSVLWQQTGGGAFTATTDEKGKARLWIAPAGSAARR